MPGRCREAVSGWPGGTHGGRSDQEIRHAQEPDLRLRADPARLAGLVLLHRQGRRAGTGRARAADRADPADPVHVSGGLPLQVAAAGREPPARRALYRHLRLLVRLFLLRVRAHRDLRAGLLHAAGFHRRPADVPAGDGAVAARARRSCSGPTSSSSSTRSRAISARSISSGIPARRSIASSHRARSSCRPASTASTASSR